jgi:hypothetical protein
MKFTKCNRDNFDSSDVVIERLQNQFKGEAESILNTDLKAKNNSISELANDLSTILVRVYKIENMFFVFETNNSLEEMCLMFRSALTEEEMQEFESVKSTYDYKKAVEFLSKNTF